MRKRRNAKEKSEAKNMGGGDGNKFSVFDFDETESRVETESRKSLSKFVTSTKKCNNLTKSSDFRQPVDKYTFLQFFAPGDNTQQNRNDITDADSTDAVLEDITFRTDVKVSRGYSKSASKASSSSFMNSSCRANSPAKGSRKSRGCTSEKKHKVFYVDSDEDGRIEPRSLTSSFDLAEKEGSSEQLLEHGIHSDSFRETVVVVDPYYVKCGTIYYTKCLLTFTKRFIRLETLPVPERKRPDCLEWSTSDILKIDSEQCDSDKGGVVKFLLKPETKDLVETRERNSGTVELEFIVLDDPQWSQKQEEIKSLDLKYKAAWYTIISASSFNEPFEDLIYPEGDPDAVFISRSDVELLRPRTFINDTIVDFYIKYLVNNSKREDQHRFHFFNTFFFRKLAGRDRNVRRALEGKKAFERVRKWTKNVNLFEKDYIFIPVNFSLHWSLIVICHPGELSKLGDSDMEDSSKLPCILHMDSIRGSHGGFENLIKSYLWEEWKEQHNKHDADTSTKFLNLDFFQLQLPQQENFFDCGLFLLHYAELFLEQALKFSSIKCCDFFNKDWFLPAEVSLKKRDHIRKLIHKIVEDSALRDPLPTCTKSVQENNVKESCFDIKYGFNDDYETEEQLNSVEKLNMRNIDKSVIDESAQPCKHLLPINQFSNMKLPIEEEAVEKQANFPPRETGSKPVVIYVQDEDCVHEVPSSSISSENLASCVVEDSEEEIGTECIKNTRRPSSLVSPMGQKMERISVDTYHNWKENRRSQRHR